MDLSERLGQLYASAIYDVLIGMCHDNCVLPPGMMALDLSHRLAGQIETINDDWGPEKNAGETLLAWTTVLSEATSRKVVMCQPNTYEFALMIELSAETINHRGEQGRTV